MNKGKYITPKKEDLERRFDEYNEKYFDGVLSPCTIRYAPCCCMGTLMEVSGDF